MGAVWFVSFQDQFCWVRKRKAKKIKLGDEWSMACLELCTRTNLWGGLAVSFLMKVELPKHGSEISVHSWELADHGWVQEEG